MAVNAGKTTNLNFGDALQAMRNGWRVARQGWNGKDMFIYLVEASTFPGSATRPPLNEYFPPTAVVEYRPHIDMKTAQGDLVPWVASQSDVLAEDWYVIS